MSSQPAPIGPIALKPIFQERIWGVETLPAWYPQPTPGHPIGEAWLTAETCVAASGPFAGKSLAELAGLHPEAFANTSGKGFPLLIKTLFPREKLSVQVHPNDAEALALGQPRGKTECWYVLSADPGATVAVGFREPLTLAEVRDAIAARTLEDKLAYIPVKAGDMVFVDAGTVHAIGPGMVVLETQQYSDVTYRLYDYGRPRELHIDAGLAVSRTTSAAGLVPPTPMAGFTRLATSAYFVVDHFKLTSTPAPLGAPTRLQMLFALTEGVSVDSVSGSIDLTAGSIVILPAEAVEYTLSGEGEVIRIAQP
jgi:mannose-6-phosphate isomerase